MRTIFFIILLTSLNTLAAEYGVFMVVKGRVLVEGASAKFEAKLNSKVQVGDMIITENDSRAKIVMSDRNIINISPNTKMKIEKYSNENGSKNVQLNLIEGKIRNNVEQKYDNKNSKFEVRTATAVAGVRGTQFVTSFDKVTKVTEVITLKGQVFFQNVSTSESKAPEKSVIVGKGEKSESGGENQSPTPPVKLPPAEINKVNNETVVRTKDPAAEGPKENREKGGEERADNKRDKKPPPGSPLIDLNKENSGIKDDTATRQLEKSKLRIITQPAN